MGVAFTVRLVARMHDRAVVAVVLDPREPVDVESVALELLGPDGAGLGARLALPLAGRLTTRTDVRAELRSVDGLPEGSTIVGRLWQDGAVTATATCPADPWTELETHALGTTAIPPASPDLELEEVGPRGRSRLLALWPWLGRARVPPADPGLLEEGGDDPIEGLNLDPEDEAFLRDLLESP